MLRLTVCFAVPWHLILDCVIVYCVYSDIICNARVDTDRDENGDNSHRVPPSLQCPNGGPDSFLEGLTFIQRVRRVFANDAVVRVVRH